MEQKQLSEAAKKRLRAGRMLLAGKSCAEAALAVARQERPEAPLDHRRLLDPGYAGIINYGKINKTTRHPQR